MLYSILSICQAPVPNRHDMHNLNLAIIMCVNVVGLGHQWTALIQRGQLWIVRLGAISKIWNIFLKINQTFSQIPRTIAVVRFTSVRLDYGLRQDRLYNINTSYMYFKRTLTLFVESFVSMGTWVSENDNATNHNHVVALNRRKFITPYIIGVRHFFWCVGTGPVVNKLYIVSQSLSRKLYKLFVIP